MNRAPAVQSSIEPEAMTILDGWRSLITSLIQGTITWSLNHGDDKQGGEDILAG